MVAFPPRVPESYWQCGQVLSLDDIILMEEAALGIEWEPEATATTSASSSLPPLPPPLPSQPLPLVSKEPRPSPVDLKGALDLFKRKKEKGAMPLCMPQPGALPHQLADSHRSKRRDIRYCIMSLGKSHHPVSKRS